MLAVEEGYRKKGVLSTWIIELLVFFFLNRNIEMYCGNEENLCVVKPG